MALNLSSGSSQEEYRNRFVAIGVLMGVIFALLVGRAWYLQVFNGRKWRQFAEANRLEVRQLPAKRGRILDRNGKIIADSRPSFDLTLTRSQVKKSVDDTLADLVELLGWEEIDRKEVRKRVKSGNPHDPVVVKRDMSRDELALILARQYAYPGVGVIDSPARSYPYGQHGSHLLGYLGEVSRKNLKKLRESGDRSYRLGDVWGISGVEKEFEPLLRGEDGGSPLVVDAWGRKVGFEFSGVLLPQFQARDPQPGTDLVLAIDADVQEAAEKAFTHEVGAIVAMDPKTGDILALVSRPEYAPDRFARGVSKTYWRELMRDPNKPIYDRALRGRYPPGSTFKLITGIAALEEKVATVGEKVYCPGHYRLGRETKRCWKRGGHGWVDFHKAIQQSCDVYFYEMGHRLGVDRIAKYARMFGMGEVTGIGINREARGLVPTEAWKQRVYHQPWVGGETLSVAIGQGALQVTPIQLSVAFAALLNGGQVLKPRIALESREPEGEVVTSYPTEIREQFSLEPAFRQAMLNGLSAVVNEVGGTAYWSGRSKKVNIGGKTGTAQVVGLKSGLDIADHAWFVGYAPVEDPKIVVTVIVEHGGHGGSTSAPIVRKIIETYLVEEL